MTNKTKILIAAGVVTSAVGLYFLWSKVIKPKMEAKADGEVQDDKKTVSETVAKQPSSNKNPTPSSLGKTPFANKTEGNKFRAWVNDNHPEYAKSLFGDGLGRTGEYDNKYMRTAWAEYGVQYENSTNENVAVNLSFSNKFKVIKDKWSKSVMQSNKAATLNVPYVSISAGDQIGEKKCDLNLFVYDRKAGEPIGGTDGWGYWIVVRTGYGQNKTVATGRWKGELTTLQVIKAMTFAGVDYTDKLGDGLFTGGAGVGAKFGDILKYPMGLGNNALYHSNSFSWCS
jgi:hypothetical protein